MYRIYSQILGNNRVLVRVPYHSEYQSIIKEQVSSVWDKQMKGWLLSLEDFCNTFDRSLWSEGVIRVVEGKKGFEEFLSKLKDIRTKEEFISVRGEVDEMRTECYPYQYGALGFLLYNGGGFVFDEMRLGKTKVALDFVNIMRKAQNIDKKCLILCPKSVVSVWEGEISKHLGEEAVKTIATVRDLKGVKAVDKYLEIVRDKFFIILNYEFFRERAYWFVDGYDFVILDEGHRIKNGTSKITKMVTEYLRDVIYKVVLTGTPFEKVEQLWSLLHFVYPERYPSYYKFVEHFCISELQEFWVKGRRKVKAKVIVGYKNQEELKRRVGDVSIRRTVEEIYKDLPERIMQVLYIDFKDLSKEERDLYDLYSGEYKRAVDREDIKKSLVKMQQVVSSLRSLGEDSNESVKIDMLEDFLEDIEEGKKVIVWASYIGTIQLLKERLKKYNPVCLYGETSNDSEEIIKRFREDKSCRVLIGNPSVGGIGVDLSVSDIMIYIDAPISYTTYLQSVDRNRAVQIAGGNLLVIFIKVRNSVDDWLTEAYQRKLSLYAHILGREEEVIEDDN